MKTRLMIGIALVLTMAVAAIAADPNVGTWKLNLAKSKLAPSTQAPMKESTMVAQEIGDEMQVTSTGVRTDGSKTGNKHSNPKNGGMVTYQEGAPAAGVTNIYTVIAPGDAYVTVLRDGKQVSVVHAVVSKDGKTNTWHIKGTDAQGKPVESLQVWEKQ
jgi:hypothetical protein